MKKKQLFAVLLAGSMTVGMAPAAAFAAEDTGAVTEAEAPTADENTETPDDGAAVDDQSQSEADAQAAAQAQAEAEAQAAAQAQAEAEAQAAAQAQAEAEAQAAAQLLRPLLTLTLIMLIKTILRRSLSVEQFRLQHP